MKVSPDVQRLLLDLADVDAELARITHRISHLPEDAELAELSSRRESARDDLVRSEIAAEDVAREYKRIDGEVSGMAGREVKDAKLLAEGGLAPKALNELQHELNGLIRRRGILEDELLATMEQQEALVAERERAEAVIVDIDNQLTEATQRRDAARGELEEERSAKLARRDQVAAEITPELLAVYDKQRANGRIGAGLLRARRCGACRMELDRGLIATISSTPADQVVRCDECGAVLVRTHESGL